MQSTDLVRFWAIVDQFMTDSRLYLLLGLILVDTIFGVAVAFKTATYDWQKLADFFRAKVVPGVLGYFILYVTFRYVAGFDNLLGQSLLTIAWGTLAATLVASIVDNFKTVFGSAPVGQQVPK